MLRRLLLRDHSLPCYHLYNEVSSTLYGRKETKRLPNKLLLHPIGHAVWGLAAEVLAVLRANQYK